MTFDELEKRLKDRTVEGVKGDTDQSLKLVFDDGSRLECYGGEYGEMETYFTDDDYFDEEVTG